MLGRAVRYISNTRKETIVASSIGKKKKKNSVQDGQIEDKTVQKNGIDDEIKRTWFRARDYS